MSAAGQQGGLGAPGVGGGEQQFCLRWNNFQANITSQFEALREHEDFVDVTLACEGRRLQAHKVVLSACSPYFKELFKSNPCPHPIIFMRDCELVHITALLEFMYAGEVNIAQAQLTSFLRTAEALQIRGLTDSPEKKPEIKNASSSKTQSSQLRNLLCGRLHHQTSKDAANSQSKQQQQFGQQQQQRSKVIRSGGGGGVRSSNNATMTTGVSSHNGLPDYASGDYEMSDGCPKDGHEDENFDADNNDNDVPGTSGGGGGAKLNPFANFAEFAGEMLEPKLEAPDYASEDESRQERFLNPDVVYGVEQSPAKLLNFQGRDSATSVGQDNRGEPEGLIFGGGGGGATFRRVKTEEVAGSGSASSGSGALPLEGLDAFGLALGRRHPSWIVGAMHQQQQQQNHNRRALVSKHDPGPPRLIKLGEGIELLEEQFRSVKWADYRKLTRSLAALLFSPAELATCSVTGQRWSRAGLEERPTKPPLDRHKVQAIISYVSRRFPQVEVSRIKQVLAYKCKENCTALRMKTVSESATHQAAVAASESSASARSEAAHPYGGPAQDQRHQN